jgi:thiol-disulfide isomerase/thioredoxin
MRLPTGFPVPNYSSILMKLRRWCALLGVLALAMSCGSPQSPAGAGNQPESQVPTASAGASSPGSPAATRAATSPVAKPTKSEPAEIPASLRFSGTTVDGKPFDGASLQGKPVLIWFWAPWCPTCRSQIPQVQRLAKQYDGQLRVIGVGSLDDAAAIKRFAAQVPGVTHLIDERGTVWKQFEVVEQSSFVLLDGRGELNFRTGYGGSEALADKVAAVAN